MRLGLFRACSSLPEFSTGLCITSSRGVSPPTRFTLFRFLIHRLISIVGAAGTTGWPDPSTVEQRLTFFLVSLSLSLCISFLSFFFYFLCTGGRAGGGGCFALLWIQKAAIFLLASAGRFHVIYWTVSVGAYCSCYERLSSSYFPWISCVTFDNSCETA